MNIKNNYFTGNEKKQILLLGKESAGIPQCGHFVPEEQPELVLERMLPFLAKHSA